MSKKEAGNGRVAKHYYPPYLYRRGRGSRSFLVGTIDTFGLRRPDEVFVGVIVVAIVG